MISTNKMRSLEIITANLRNITSLRDFVAAVEVGASTAHKMLDDVENRLI